MRESVKEEPRKVVYMLQNGHVCPHVPVIQVGDLSYKKMCMM